MYEYIPNPKTKKAKTIGSVLFFLSLAVFLASAFPIFAYRGVLQFASIALMTVSVLLLGKYAAKSYIYRIEETDFVIEELTRTARTAVCRLELAKLLKIEPWTKAPKGTRGYNYCVDIAPEGSYLLTFADGAYAPYDKAICVRFQPDDKMAALLKEMQHEL